VLKTEYRDRPRSLLACERMVRHMSLPHVGGMILRPDNQYSSHFFVPGGRYQNASGVFRVLRIDSEHVVVQYESGPQAGPPINKRVKDMLSLLTIRRIPVSPTPQTTSRTKQCWACGHPVFSESRRCKGCKWIECRCGACQCPDFWNGRRANNPECLEQPRRLGKGVYLQLCSDRERRRA
jgi:hypothetical protein